MLNKFYLSFCVILAIMLVSCKTDDVTITQEDLLGNWEISEAKRNGKITRLLRGGFFTFDNQGMMITNVRGDTIKSKFSIKGSTITQLSSEPATFNVNKLSGDTLLLKAKLNKKNYEFLTLKANEK